MDYRRKWWEVDIEVHDTCEYEEEATTFMDYRRKWWEVDIEVHDTCEYEEEATTFMEATE